MSITTSNLLFTTQTNQDYSGTIFDDPIVIIMCIQSGSLITMPISQPTLKVVHIQPVINTGLIINVKFGSTGTPIAVGSGQQLTVYYYGINGFGFSYYYSSLIRPSSSTQRVAYTYVTIDPVTFSPSFDPPIGLTDSGGSTAGNTNITSSTPVAAIVATANEALTGYYKVDVSILTPTTFQVGTSLDGTTPAMQNFFLFVGYS